MQEKMIVVPPSSEESVEMRSRLESLLQDLEASRAKSAELQRTVDCERSKREASNAEVVRLRTAVVDERAKRELAERRTSALEDDNRRLRAASKLFGWSSLLLGVGHLVRGKR